MTPLWNVRLRKLYSSDGVDNNAEDSEEENKSGETHDLALEVKGDALIIMHQIGK